MLLIKLVAKTDGMKLRPTPFFFISIALVIFGLYVLLINDGGFFTNMGVISMGLAIIFILATSLFNRIFKKKIWAQAGVELIISSLILFYFLLK